MSRFSTTVYIKNNVDRMRFVNTFSDIMKKRGFVPCSEDEAAQSYMFAYDDGWVTLANEEYNVWITLLNNDILYLLLKIL